MIQMTVEQGFGQDLDLLLADAGNPEFVGWVGGFRQYQFSDGTKLLSVTESDVGIVSHEWLTGLALCPELGDDNPPPVGTVPLFWFYLHGEAEKISPSQDLLRYWGEGSPAPSIPPKGIPLGVTEAILVTPDGAHLVQVYAWKPAEGYIPLRGLVVLPDDETAVAQAAAAMEQRRA